MGFQEIWKWLLPFNIPKEGKELLPRFPNNKKGLEPIDMIRD
jgi:hypothetical protein